ncbi:MAG: DUF192 domain-containing protein [Chloroflexi bacterium]|nr:DUF192 domain-containing protein [Chloroflexota bacterium]
MRAINLTRRAVLMEKGTVAASAWSRMRGLLGHAPLRAGEGLVLRGEKAIHTVGMGFPIDILFLGRDGRVIHLMRSVRPFRFSPMVWAATDVVELPAGTLELTSTAVGDQIELV